MRSQRAPPFRKLQALLSVCLIGCIVQGGRYAIAGCLVPPPVFKEHGVLYAAPYDYEVRVKLGCIMGRCIGDAIKSAQEIQALDETAELPSMFNAISPGWWLKQLNSRGVRVERCAWQHLEFETIDPDYVVQEGDRARLMIHVHERAAPDVEIQAATFPKHQGSHA